MILKFDHISYIGLRKEKDAIVKKITNPLFTENALFNLNIKKTLMKKYQEDHDLIFDNGVYPTEYIFYDEVNNQSRISLTEGIVYGAYSNKINAVTFLRTIFGNKVEEEDGCIKCNMKGILDKRDYLLVLDYTDSSCQSFLDDSGYGVITLVTNSIIDTIPIDGICTPTEKICVNGKEIEVCFTRSDSVNVIFEIIRFV